ncbi:hypothetical protein AX16_002013 [Volvariella volvacea WC 439]|nr:hypothetical protein AX16_002013 [Volvariella volvacea WC 439]
MTTHTKAPLLALKLSSTSFLDSVVHDDLSRHPLYTITTVNNLTKVIRPDPWEGSYSTAEIKWPKERPTKGKGKGKDTDGVLIQMRGARWKGGEVFLRPGTFSNARRFNIPNYSQPLKWRLVGDTYWCTTTGVKGPIAIFDPATELAPARIKVYETLVDKYDPLALDAHRGVSILLLDYLLVTALLLVTDLQEWMVVKTFEHDEQVTLPSSIDPHEGIPLASSSTSASQWRKIMYGEPLYPKRSTRKTSPRTSADGGTVSPGQLAKLAYGIPIYPTLRNARPRILSSDSEEWVDGHEPEDVDTDDDIEYDVDALPSRPASPSAESTLFPQSSTSAPSHTYLDPSFYRYGMPPVPPLPPQYAPGGSSQPQEPTTLSSADNIYRGRELPVSTARARSTPPSTVPMSSLELSSLSFSGAIDARSFDQPKRVTSISTRPLPHPPVPPHTSHSPNATLLTSPAGAHSLRHIQSQSSFSSHRFQSMDKHYTRIASLRSLPPTPISSSAPGTDHVPAHPSSRSLLSRAETTQPYYGQLRMHAVHEPEDRHNMEWIDSLVRVSNTTTSMVDAPPPSYSSIFGNGSS